MKKTKRKNSVEEPVVKLQHSKKRVIEAEIINLSDLPPELQKK